MSSMDGDGGLNMPNWGYYEPPPLKSSHLGLQLMTSMADRKPLIGSGRDSNILANVNNGGGGPFHHHRDLVIPTSHYQMDYMRDTWMNRDNKFFNMLPPNPGYGVLPESTSSATAAITTPLHHHHHHLHQRHHPVQMLRQPESSSEDRMMVRTDGIIPDNINGPPKKRSSGKTEKGPRAKKPKKASNAAKDGSGGSVQRAKTAKKPTEVVINGIDMDISILPIPVCSCTGAAQQCYRWGSGGWQSACCTTVMSMYPLPMSTKRRGARIAGRKMSFGAFKKVLEKLAAEGYNFEKAIDLRTYWAKHGTNKFVTIR